ncbi:MAG TPA: zinc metalloprotease [Kofleriaceae bacterium]|jgi:hypothetical protein
MRIASLASLASGLCLILAVGCSTSVDNEPDGSKIADPLDDGYDECAERDWYGDGQCDTGCVDPDPDCISAGCDDACSSYCDASWSGDALPALPDDCTVEMCDCGEPPVECPDLCASQCFGEPLPDEIPPDCPSFTCDCAEAAFEPDPSGILATAGSGRHCGARSPDASTKAELDGKDSAGAFLATASGARGKRTIPIVFHVIRRKGGAGDVGRSRLIKQVKVMNRSYARTPFKFKLSKITRTTNGTWFTMGMDSSAEAKAKKNLHRGGMATLNVYTTNNDTNDALAWATFPWEHRGNQDGVVMNYGTLPGGDERDFNLGDTLVHEAGHWVGLFHTFEGGCSSPGDTVGDTSAEAEPNFGCPIGRNSCAGQGTDPVKNFMDYTDDSCMNNFTAGQRARMARWVKWYRPASGSRDGGGGTEGCGDGTCTGDETDATCAADCGCAANECSGVSPFGCYCDADCAATGDCCADADICQ